MLWDADLGRCKPNANQMQYKSREYEHDKLVQFWHYLMKPGWLLLLEPIQGRNVGRVRSNESIPIECQLSMESRAEFIEPCVDLPIKISNGQVILDEAYSGGSQGD